MTNIKKIKELENRIEVIKKKLQKIENDSKKKYYKDFSITEVKGKDKQGHLILGKTKPMPMKQL